MMNPGSWLKCGALIVGGLALTWVCFVDAVSQSFSKTSPDLVLRLDSTVPLATIQKVGTQMVGRGRIPAPVARAKLRSAMVQEPLSAKGLSYYGATFDSQKATPVSRKYFALAERVSRRELGAQMVFVMEDAKAGNEEATMARIDRMLRTNFAARDRLFPLLAGVVTRPDGRRAMARYLRRDTPWLADFSIFAIEQGIDPTAVTRWVVAMGGLPDGGKYREIEILLFRALDTRRQYPAIARLLPIAKATPKHLTQSAAINDASLVTEWQPLSWELAEGSGLIVSPVVNDKGNGLIFSISLSGGISGNAVRKLLLLPAGEYRLRIDQRASATTSGEVVPVQSHWQFTCLDGETPQALWTSEAVMKRIDETIRVPEGCGVQQLQLRVRAPNDHASSEALIGPISLQRISK